MQQKPASTPAQSQQQNGSSFDFGLSQMQMPPKQEVQHIGMAMIPETPVDLSMLNLDNDKSSGFSSSQGMGFNYQHPTVYSVRDLPQGPSPLDLAVDSIRHSRQRSAQNDYLSWNTDAQNFVSSKSPINQMSFQ